MCAHSIARADWLPLSLLKVVVGKSYQTQYQRDYLARALISIWYGRSSSLHRKVFGLEDYVTMTYNPAYFVTAKGLNKLFEDMEQKKDMNLILKIVYMFVFQLANSAYTQGEKWTKDAKLLSLQEAQKKGLKSPCLYIRPSFLERVFLFLLSRIIYMMVYCTNSLFGQRGNESFQRVTFAMGTGRQIQD